MHAFLPLAMVMMMSTLVADTSAQTLSAPQAITDPKQISSKPNAQVEPRSLTIEKLYTTRQIGPATWSPDGKSVAFISNMSGRNSVWTVPAEGGWPVQLTISDQRQTAPAWSPDGKWIAYQSDYDGDEQWDIFLVSPKTGKIVNLTQTREIAEASPTWSRSEEHTSELQSHSELVCRLLLEKKNNSLPVILINILWWKAY